MSRPKTSRAPALVFGLVAAALAACSAANAPTGSGASASNSAPPCPASLDDVASAVCTVEGQTCPYLFPCEPISASTSCVCSGGRFACGAPPGGAGDASCSTPAPAETCPSTELKANGLFCNEPGLICPYPSPCSGIPAYDECQCTGPRTANETAHFECTTPCEARPDASPQAPDASTPDATPSDANPDAPTD
jgi:hypothetical protein